MAGTGIPETGWGKGRYKFGTAFIVPKTAQSGARNPAQVADGLGSIVEFIKKRRIVSDSQQIHNKFTSNGQAILYGGTDENEKGQAGISCNIDIGDAGRLILHTCSCCAGKSG